MAKIVVLAGAEDAEAAKAALEGASLDFEIVDPTPANLLHIVIGMVDDGEEKEPKEPKEEKPPAEEPAADEPPADDTDIASDASAVPESIGTVVIDGETVNAVLGEKANSVLRSIGLETGARTSYTINESVFSFWPSNPVLPTQRIVVEHGSHRTSIEVLIDKAVGTQTYFEVGTDLADLFKTK